MYEVRVTGACVRALVSAAPGSRDGGGGGSGSGGGQGNDREDTTT